MFQTTSLEVHISTPALIDGKFISAMSGNSEASEKEPSVLKQRCRTSSRASALRASWLLPHLRMAAFLTMPPAKSAPMLPVSLSHRLRHENPFRTMGSRRTCGAAAAGSQRYRIGGRNAQRATFAKSQVLAADGEAYAAYASG